MLLLDLFLTFMKIGAFTFGGGYAMLPLLEQELMHHSWATEAELLNLIAISESTPGPFAVNAATYIGTKLAGLPGAVFATLGLVTPSFVIILIVSRAYEKFQKNRYVKGAISGLRPAAIGLIASAVLTIGNAAFAGMQESAISNFGTPSFFGLLAIFGVSLFLVFKKKLHPIFIVLISAAAGIIMGYAGVV